MGYEIFRSSKTGYRGGKLLSFAFGINRICDISGIGYSESS